MLEIKITKCLYCGGCVGVCPTVALSLNGTILAVDNEACNDCGLCAKFCPVGALEVKK
jgi:ferredoxin